MGPDIPFLPSPDTEELGEAAVWALLLKPAIDWLTPEANTNCSLSSTLVRPFAKKEKTQVSSHATKSNG